MFCETIGIVHIRQNGRDSIQLVGITHGKFQLLSCFLGFVNSFYTIWECLSRVWYRAALDLDEYASCKSYDNWKDLRSHRIELYPHTHVIAIILQYSYTITALTKHTILSSSHIKSFICMTNDIYGSTAVNAIHPTCQESQQTSCDYIYDYKFSVINVVKLICTSFKLITLIWYFVSTIVITICPTTYIFYNLVVECAFYQNPVHGK